MSYYTFSYTLYLSAPILILCSTLEVIKSDAQIIHLSSKAQPILKAFGHILQIRWKHGL